MKKTPLHLLELKNVPILQQLYWEEALLRADDRNWCLINHGTPPAIVMGISGKMEELIDREQFATAPIPIIRRFSGGGTVVVDEQTLFITFIFNAKEVPISPYPEHIMRWTEQIYRPVFNHHPFELKENDYVCGERKFGGNAQSITKQRWLHHSTLLFDFNPNLMRHLTLPKRAPQYRSQRSHSDFLCCLRDHWPSMDQLKIELSNQLKKKFELSKIENVIELLSDLDSKPHRTATRLENLLN